MRKKSKLKLLELPDLVNVVDLDGDLEKAVKLRFLACDVVGGIKLFLNLHPRRHLNRKKRCLARVTVQWHIECDNIITLVCPSLKLSQTHSQQAPLRQLNEIFRDVFCHGVKL